MSPGGACGSGVLDSVPYFGFLFSLGKKTIKFFVYTSVSAPRDSKPNKHFVPRARAHACEAETRDGRNQRLRAHAQ